MLINFNDLLLSNKVTGIIHIGAHQLEELADYLKGNVNNVIWIEANPNKYDFINNKLKKYENMVLGKFAAGSKNGYQILNLANNGQSSSILELGTHLISYPKINYDSKIEVEIKKLDNWLDENFKNKKLYNFINIDIQGYELEALKGMTNQLKIADYIYLEVNFEQVYKNCAELKEIDKLLIKFGFQRVALRKTNAGWGDAFYTKNNNLFSRFYYFILLRIKKSPTKAYIFLLRVFRKIKKMNKIK
tara:strand:- start:82 stop:819 length:738 start_codon:yes stop_codon:yes gene_type:complete